MSNETYRQSMDKRSFAMGMIAAFSECVAADAKPLALSPPLCKADFEALREDAADMITAYGLSVYYEMNADLPEDKRFYWMVIYAQAEALDAYLRLRANGENPSKRIDAFAGALGYGPKRTHTGYDAYVALFQ